MDPDLRTTIKNICNKDRRYAEDAYYFVNEAVGFAAEYFTKPEFGSNRHLSGPELLEGMREFTLSEFGSMSKAVLKRWGIKTTLDFGHIVFNLIDGGVLAASPTDKLGDFDNVYNFDTAFIKPFEPEHPAIPLKFKLDSL